jgi:hypothetical protein
MNLEQVRNFFRQPTPEELQNHVRDFYGVIEANPDYAPYDLLSTEELDRLIRKAIVMYIRLEPGWDERGNTIYWGMDAEQLINTGNWRDLSLTDTAPRDQIAQYLRMLILDHLGISNSGQVYRWMRNQQREGSTRWQRRHHQNQDE